MTERANRRRLGTSAQADARSGHRAASEPLASRQVEGRAWASAAAGTGAAAPAMRRRWKSTAGTRMLLQLQRRAGNRAVARLLGSHNRPHLAVQRHSDSALEAQIEEAEAADDLTTVQRHAAPRNRRFSAAGPSDAAVDALKTLIAAETPNILAKLKATVAPRTASPAAATAMLVGGMVKIDTTTDLGLSSPAVAQGDSFRMMVRSPYFYDESGQVDEPFVKATLIHEALHCLSYEHTGVQNVEYDAAGGKKRISPEAASDPDASPLDSLDEALTEQLSMKVYDLLYPGTPYKTNYWQGIRDVGVHMTDEGFARMVEQSNNYKEKNWTGDLASLVVGNTSLSMADLEDLYLKGLDSMDRTKKDEFGAQYGAVLRTWHEQKDKAWKGALPKGVMLAEDWVSTLNNLLVVATSLGEGVDDALKRVASHTGGHTLVAASDPRSHLYGKANPRFKDDLQLLDDHFPGAGTGRALTFKAGLMETPKDKRKDPLGWEGAFVGKEGSRFTTGAATTAMAAASTKLGLKGEYPHLVIPKPKQDTLGSTPFQQYEVFVKSTDGKAPDISADTMAARSGVENAAWASQVIENRGGGAYEHNGTIIYANSLRERTLLHEVGHYKQDRAGFTEASINPKLLEYHNIVTVENPQAEDVKVRGQMVRMVRLAYGLWPKVLPPAEWETTITSTHDQGEPPAYELLKRRAKGKEKDAIDEIEAALAGTMGGGRPVVYTNKMKWYLKQSLATEYFQAAGAGSI